MMNDLNSDVRVLISAFEPFGGSAINGSQEVGRLLAANDRVEILTLPVVRGEAPRLAWERLQHGPPPALYLALGEAGPEPQIRLEKVAINWDDYRLPDNAGNQPRDEAIVSDGATAYFATIPVARIASSLEGKTPLPVKVSLSAGAFLCNHLAYSILNRLRENPICPFSFVHVPSWRPEQGEQALQDIATTLKAVIDTTLEAIPQGE